MDWNDGIQLTQNNTFSHFCTAFFACLIFPHGKTHEKPRQTWFLAKKFILWNYSV